MSEQTGKYIKQKKEMLLPELCISIDKTACAYHLVLFLGLTYNEMSLA